MFSSCHSGYSLASVEGSRIEVTAALDANPDSAAIACFWLRIKKRLIVLCHRS